MSYNSVEIFKYTTEDGGVSWSSTQVTSNTPEGILNVRPYVPMNHKPGYFDVLWMRGTYVHYTNYSTSIMYHSSAESEPENDYSNDSYFFDFGTTTSPVAAEAIGISEGTMMGTAYGWTLASGISSRSGETPD